ncbi:Mannose-1-phosphate guanyltransferase alpha [Dirofilaria immitis]
MSSPSLRRRFKPASKVLPQLIQYLAAYHAIIRNFILLKHFHEVEKYTHRPHKQLNLLWRITWNTENWMNTDDGLHARGAIHMGIASLLHLSPWYNARTVCRSTFHVDTLCGNLRLRETKIMLILLIPLGTIPLLKHFVSRLHCHGENDFQTLNRPPLTN